MTRPNVPLPTPPSGNGAAPGEMIICLVDGSTIIIDPGAEGADTVSAAMRAPGDGKVVTVFNQRTGRVELLRATAIMRVILPEDIG